MDCDLGWVASQQKHILQTDDSWGLSAYSIPSNWGANPSILKWKSRWLITVSSTWPLSVMLYHPRTPVGPQHMAVLFLSVHILHLLCVPATQRRQDIPFTEKRGKDIRSLNIKATFRSELCCLSVSNHNLVCVLLGHWFSSMPAPWVMEQWFHVPLG